MKNLSVFILLCSLSFSANAFDFNIIKDGLNKISGNSKGSKQFSSFGELRTNNSQFLYDGKIPENAKWIMFVFEKDGEKFQDLYEVNSNQDSILFYLKKGPGLYKVKVHYSASEKYWETSMPFLTSAKIRNEDQRNLDFLLPTKKVQSADPVIVNLSNEIVGTETDPSIKVKLIHDYLLELLTYDIEGYRTKEYLNAPLDALSVLRRKMTVCAGYSHLFAALLRAQGIRTAIVHGEADLGSHWELHAWNAVMINDSWEMIDLTWNDGLNTTEKYYMPKEEDFSKDHRNWELKEAI